ARHSRRMPRVCRIQVTSRPNERARIGATSGRETQARGGVSMRDFAIHMSQKPGELGRVANALARGGVNLKAVTGMAFGNQAMLHLIPDDVAAARAALQESNIRFDESEVATVLLENRAGELALVADKLANAGLNLQAVYVIGLDGDLVELAIVSD